MSRTNELGQPIGAPLDFIGPWSLPPHKTLIGRYCVLRPPQQADALPLYQAFGQDHLGKNWTYLPFTPAAGFENFNEWFLANCFGSDPLYYVVTDSKDRPLGLASYLRINPTDGSLEVGWIHFSALMQRTPISSEAMYLMMAHVFDDLRYRRYEWKCDALNAPSRAAAQRLGFTFEGIFRQCTHYKGRNRDTAWFSILDHEWPARKALFEVWLDPANFDAQGQQIARLNP